MGEKRKNLDELDTEIKKLKTENEENHALSVFELFPDNVLMKICEEVSNKDVQNLFLVSNTVCTRVSNLKSVMRRFEVDLNKIDHARRHNKDVFLNHVNLKFRSETTTRKSQPESLKFEETFEMFPNTESLELWGIEMDCHVDYSLSILKELKYLTISGLFELKDVETLQNRWILPNLEHLDLTVNIEALSMIFHQLHTIKSLTSIRIKIVKSELHTKKNGKIEDFSEFFQQQAKLKEISLEGLASKISLFKNVKLPIEELNIQTSNIVLIEKVVSTITEYLKCCELIKEVYFDNIDSKILKVLMALPNLKKIDSKTVKIKTAGFSNLTMNKSIENLAIGHFTDGYNRLGAVEIGDFITKFENLETLEVRSNLHISLFTGFSCKSLKYLTAFSVTIQRHQTVAELSQILSQCFPNIKNWKLDIRPSRSYYSYTDMSVCGY